MPLDQYTIQLAQTVDRMFAAGKRDPSASEIALEHFQGRILGSEIAEGIRRRLPRICALLTRDFGQRVYLLGETYYTRYRDAPPTTEAEARTCLPSGRRSMGIAIHIRNDDLIYRVTLQTNMSAGAGKVKKSLDNAIEAQQVGQFSKNDVISLAQSAERSVRPTKQLTSVLPTSELPALLAPSKKE